MVRRCRDGHRATWWAADLRLAGLAPAQTLRLVAVTTDPARLPADSTWYRLTNLPHPDAPHATTAPIGPADLAEVARRYGRRRWGEQGDKQLKQERGWADWQGRTDRAIRRHGARVCAACSCCWWAWSRAPDATARPVGTTTTDQPMPVANAGRGGHVAALRLARRPAERVVAGGPAAGPSLAAALDPALALLARLVVTAAAPAAPGAPRLALAGAPD